MSVSPVRSVPVAAGVDSLGDGSSSREAAGADVSHDIRAFLFVFLEVVSRVDEVLKR